MDKETGEEYIEVTIEDIEEANKLMKEVLLRKSDQLNGATRDYFEELKAYLIKEEKTVFTNISARQALRVNASNQKRYMIALQEWGLVRKTKGNRKNGFAYEITTFEDLNRLSENINQLLNQIVDRIKALPKQPKKASGSSGSK